jgi:hypothetical protein
MRLIFTVNFLLIFISQSALAEVLKSEVSQTCYTNKSEWIQHRQDLLKSKKITDVFALARQFSNCEAKSPLKDAGLSACFSRLVDFSNLLESSNDEWISLENAKRLRHPDKLKLPASMQDIHFWSELSSKEDSKIVTALKNFSRLNPETVTFKYTSHLQPRIPFYITVIDKIESLWILDYDSDLNINAYVEDKLTKERALVSIDRETFTTKEHEKYVSVAEINPSAFTQPLSEQGGRCYQCHQAPVLPILPLASKPIQVYSGKKSNAEILKWFNQTYTQDKDTFPVSKLSFLPSLGDLNSEEAARLQKSCLPGLSGLKKIRVTESLQCIRCHSDSGIMPAIKLPAGPYGNINSVSGKEMVEWDLSVHPEAGVNHGWNSLGVIPQIMIQEGHMPPDYADVFSITDRKNIFNCLMEDYLGSLYSAYSAKSKREGRLLKALLKVTCEN